MDQSKIMQAVLGILVALMAWNFKTVNSLQVEVAQINTGHVSNETVHQLQRQVDRLEILLQTQAAEK